MTASAVLPGGLTMPDNAANSTTSDVELIFRGILSGAGVVASKDAFPDLANRSWNWTRTTLDLLRFYWWPSGEASSENHLDYSVGFGALADGNYHWIKMTFDANNGAGSSAYTIYYAADQNTVPVSWTTLGTQVLGPATSIGDSAAPISFGVIGNVKYFSFAPTVGASPTVVFDAPLVPATSPTSPTTTTQTGGTWTLVGTWELALGGWSVGYVRIA